jgi:dipeptidyl aminopeptidase/acylaminoacyl peptidase
VLALLLPAGAQGQEKRRLEFTDLMQLRQIEDLTTTPDGRWLAFTARPDRGDPEAVFRATAGDGRWAVELGAAPALADDGRWAAARLEPSLEARETSDDEAPEPGMALVSLVDGTTETVQGVRTFAFAPGGRWLAVHHAAPEEPEDAAAVEEPEGGQAADTAEATERGPEPGTILVLRDLEEDTRVVVEHVTRLAFDPDGATLAYVVSDPDGDDGLFVRTPGAGDATPVRVGPDLAIPAMAWADEGGRLVFTAAVEEERGEPGEATLWTWDGGEAREAATAGDLPEGWTVKPDATLRVSDDGERVFFGARPAAEGAEEGEAPAGGEPEGEAEDEPAFEPYDVDAILSEREVAVWNWQDERIQPQQEVEWSRRQDRAFTAVHHLSDGATVLLEDEAFELDGRPDNPLRAVARVTRPYRRSYTWDTWRYDAWLVDLATGERTPVTEGLAGDVELSPDGRFVAWYDGGEWFLHDARSGATRNVTEALGVPFAQEDWDYPGPAESYGVAGWTEDDEALLLYDRYDVWRVPTAGGDAVNLTEGTGREEHRVYRVVDTDPDTEALPDAGPLLLRGFDDDTKASGFWRARTDRPGVERLVEDDKIFTFRVKPEDADLVVFTREDFDEFPDLWVASPDLSDPRRVTDVNPGIADFLWGSEELIEYTSADGLPLQGALFKPEGFDPSRRYPVLIYYYRYMSQRLHEFNEPVVNHRPSFPMYTSNGYLVFLPDVRFEVGRPGLSAVKSVVPAAQKLVDLGYADPDGLGLHGHSWSGYQTAFVITQTDVFDAAVAGAPVGNMTSAYAGIRWGSGLARMFQYEKGQSRLSGSLWEARDEYIDNSPVFFADRVRTPVLIMHGDEDDAVPWYQSIEYYLALRRLDKPAVFLQYRGEPHHPRKYANKLDYSIKMMEFFDHFLKGEPAPEWWAEGVEYEGGGGG